MKTIVDATPVKKETTKLVGEDSLKNDQEKSIVVCESPDISHDYVS